LYRKKEMRLQQFFITATTLFFILNIGYSKHANTIRNAVLAEVKRYPKLEIQDLYKLAYQAAMGNEHLMNDTTAVRMYLEEEFTSIDSSSQEPLIEYLTSDSSIARVHLRAWKKQKRNQEKLFQAMVMTASAVQPSTDLLLEFWNDVETLAEKGTIPFNKRELNEYFQKMEQQNFPPVHHSKIFRNSFHPAYRIISKSALLSIFEK